MTPRLSAIIECPSPSQAPARPDPPAVKASHRDSAATQTHANGLCDDKEIEVTSEIVKSPTPKHDMPFIDKEVAVSNGTGLKKVRKDSDFNYYFGWQLDLLNLMDSCSHLPRYDRRGSQFREYQIYRTDCDT